MKHLYRKCTISTFIITFCLSYHFSNGQTVPSLSTGLEWDQWYLVNSVQQIESQFNAGRRHEESNLGLSPNELGALQLDANFLSLPFEEQALILLNAERNARNGVRYGSTTYTVVPFEGAEYTLCDVSQGHADDMQTNNFFGHTGSDGSNSYSRITGAFPGCTEGTSENIAWNSIGGNGFIAAIPFAIYNFIYDDACCGWGHRINCLKMSLSTNNYNGTSRFGIVGFGRATGANGDFFVMDYFDPEPASGNCSYDLMDFSTGGGTSDCPDNIDLTGTISTGIYQAVSVNSSGTVLTNSEVDLIGAIDVNLDASFEVQAGSELTIEIQSCNGANAQHTNSSSDWNAEEPVFINGEPEFRRSAEN